jgi:undecaprenyl-diphosphatase
MLDALLVGCAQALAVVPGLSRSGSTIAAGMTRGFSRSFAVRFSFLLSLPAVLGANLLSLLDAAKEGVDPQLIPVYLVGMVVAMASGYFAIGLVRLLADKGKFGKFSYYCWAVGALALIANFVLK